jgi:DeoR family fructose operon transcriptional repressor
MSVEAIQRQELIRNRIEKSGRVKVSELATELGVSEMTIRRDLIALSKQGFAQRVRGGALAIGPQPFAKRYGRAAVAKDRVADKLLELVGEGGAIGIDASTTLQRLAARLGGARDLTVVTNGPECFTVLQEHPGVTALLTGGQLDRRTGSLVGPIAVRASRDLLLRQVFLSAAAIDSAHGTSEATLEEAEVKHAMAEVASRVVVAIDSTKLNQRAPARCLPLEAVDVLVTELDPSDPRLLPYREFCEVR